MINTTMKAGPKGSATAKFWEIIVQEMNAGKLSPPSFLPQPYKEMKELAEESKNPISSLPKLNVSLKVGNTPENLLSTISIFDTVVDENYKEQFARILLEDYVSELFLYYSKQRGKKYRAYKEIPAVLLQKLLIIPNVEVMILHVLMKQMYAVSSHFSIPVIVANILLLLITKNPNSDQATTYKGLIVKYVQEFMRNLDKMGFSAISRFVAFLSFYIHRMDYSWNWETVRTLPLPKTSHWTEVTEEDKGAPQEDIKKTKHRYLLKYLISELQKLSYASKMQEILPKDLYEFICPETAPFKYNTPEEVGYSDAQIILDRIKERITGEQLAVLVTSTSTQIEAEGELLFDIIVRCILSLAQYKFSKQPSQLQKIH
eukprot:TRINITY_DN2034_c0_g1_i3.p1 TRINITY_DN2034_c0_g1~~TRINITY_DN2034_c0_g1_i3.p1  ORF type:complete len:373 (+),score=41.04 TRINITY_DN2034_c0_g1_i3:4447-5565(+)